MSSVPENGTKKVPLDTEITLKFKCSDAALRLCTEAIQDPTTLSHWSSSVDILPSKLRANDTLQSLIDEVAKRRYEDAKEKEDKRRSDKKAAEGLFAMNNEPPLSESYATLRALAYLEASREVAHRVCGISERSVRERLHNDSTDDICGTNGGANVKFPDPGAIAGDMEAYFDYNQAELARRGLCALDL